MPILRAQLSHLHYITPIANLRSIREFGILSHNAARRVTHASVAMQDIQEIRATKQVPGGLRLHDYVNLFFDARNVMMWARKERHRELCVLVVRPDVLDLDGVVVTDGNASSAYTRFMTPADGLGMLDPNLVYAESWTDPDPIQLWRRRSARSAEVLVPHRVAPDYIAAVRTSCDEAQQTVAGELAGAKWTLVPVKDGHLFFQA